MKRTLLPLYRLGIHLLWLVCFYFCFRILFFLFNTESFSQITISQFLGLLFKGIRFDLSTIFILNLPFIFLLLIPGQVQTIRLYKKLVQWVFYIPNGIAFLFEIADWRYFHFNHRRTTADILDLLDLNGDFWHLLPGFVRDYPMSFILSLLILGLLFWSYHKTELSFLRKEALLRLIKKKPLMGENTLTIRWAVLILVLGFSFLFIRGGTQYIPLSLSNAVSMTEPEYVPMLINTPFSIIKTIGKKELEPVQFMPVKEAISLIHPIKYFGDSMAKFQQKNVVIIILESFSREFTGLVRPRGTSLTPVLDSLMQRGLAFTNGYANGLHSADGIPAVLAGVPALMDQLYTLTPYNGNEVTSFASLLRTKGYETLFFHGGTNGTFNFNAFASAAGFQKYIGRREYGNNKDYDGNWGIYDEPFLQFFAKSLNEIPKPFMAAVFTLSSHPPFTLPKLYKERFKGGNLAIYPTLRYTDWAVGNFFKAVSNQPWFKNTVFVITADHCSPESSNEYYCCGNGRYEIPMLLYDPGNPNLRGRDPRLIEQIDLLPTVMDYLHYPDSFYALGQSAFRETAPRFVVNKLNGVFNWISQGQQYFLTDKSLIEAYKFPEDSLRKNNLLVNPGYIPDSSSLHLFHAFLQLYEEGVAGNEMTKKRFNSSKNL